MHQHPSISLIAWQAAGRTFNYQGHEIFCRTAGDKSRPALVLIHGFPTASWDWEAVWISLAERYYVLTLDMIGFGFSAKPRAHRYSIFEQADLFEHFLGLEAIREYHILAHDYGDTVAQELLARQPEAGQRPKILSVALLNGGLFPESHHPALVQKLLLSPLGPLVAQLSSRRVFSANLQRIFGIDSQPTPELLEGFWLLASRDSGMARIPALIQYMPERRQHRGRWVGAMVNSPVPLTLIDGLADPISGRHMVDRYLEVVPAPRITGLPQIGHYPQCEAPDEVLKAFYAFQGAIPVAG